MARELKVKVTADMSASFKKLINMLEKPQKLNVKVNVSDGGLKKMTDKLNKLSNKKVSVRVNAESKHLDRLSKKLDGLKDKKVSVKANTDGLGGLDEELEKAKRKSEDLNNTKISPIGVAAGLAPLLVTLDQISDKILSIANQTIAPVVKDTWSDSMDLFDTQKSFEVQMKGLGMADKQLNQIIKDMNAYGKQSKYSIAQMLNAYSEFRGAGDDDPQKLIKGMAGLASYGKNPNHGFNALLTNLTEGANTDAMYTSDWRQIRKAIGASASKSVRDWFRLNKGIELTKDNLSEGKITIGDFKEAIEAVGNGDTFQKMATQTNTLKSAYDNLRESLTSAMVGDLENKGPITKLGETLVKQINDFSKAAPMIAKQISQGLDYIFDVFGKNFSGFNAKDFLKDLAKSFKEAKPVIDTLAKALGKLTNNGKDTGKVVGNLIKFAAGWKLFRGLAQPVLSLASAGATLLKVAQGFGALKGGGIFSKLFGKFGTGGTGGKSFDVGKIKTQALNTAKNIGTILAVVGTVWASAKALESVSKMDIDFNVLMQNLGSIASGLTLAGGYITAVGVAMDKFKSLRKNLLVGAGAVSGVAGTLTIVSKAIEKISQAKIKNKNLLKNLGTIALTLTSAGAFMSAIGVALTKIPMAGTGLAVGAGAMIGISAALKIVSEKTDDMVKNLVTTANRMDDIDVSAGDIAKGIGKLTELSVLLGSLGTIQIHTGTFSAIGGALSALGNEAQNWNIDSAIKLMSKIKDMKVPESGEFNKKMSDISGILRSLSLFNFVNGATGALSGLSAFNNAMSALGNITGEWNFDTAFNLIKKINSMEIPNVSDFKEKIGKIRSLMTVINSLNSDSIKESINEAGISFFDSISSYFDNFNIGNIQNVINKITQISTALANFNLDEKAVTDISKKLKTIKKIATKLKEVVSQNSVDSVEDKAENAVGSGLNAGSSWLEGFNVDNIISQVSDVMKVVNKLNSFTIDEKIVEEVGKKLKSIKKVRDKLMEFVGQSGVGGQIIGGVKGFIGGLYGSAGNASENLNLETIVTTVEKMKSIITTLTSIPDFDYGTISQKIDNIKKAIEKVRDLTINKNADSSVGGGEGTMSLGSVLNSVKKVVEIATAINSIPEIGDGIVEKVQNIKLAVENLMKIGEGIDPEGAGVLQTLLTQVNSTLTQLQSLTAQFTTTGTSYAQALVSGFNSGNINRIVTKVEGAIKAIDSKSDLTSIGKRMSDTLSSGFNADGLIQKINSIQSAINSLHGKTVNININETTTKRTVKKANGGIIPEYHSTGGRVGGRMFKQRGTDTVPAMLTPGEYVLKRSVTNALGKGFLDALNNMNLSSAMARLQNKVAGNNITNNTYNNITQNVDNKASYLNGLGSIRRVVRS